MDYYYSQAKIIIENANKRKNQSNKNWLIFSFI
jgi:hypothetical protein